MSDAVVLKLQARLAGLFGS